MSATVYSFFYYSPSLPLSGLRTRTKAPSFFSSCYSSRRPTGGKLRWEVMGWAMPRSFFVWFFTSRKNASPFPRIFGHSCCCAAASLPRAYRPWYRSPYIFCSHTHASRLSADLFYSPLVSCWWPDASFCPIFFGIQKRGSFSPEILLWNKCDRVILSSRWRSFCLASGWPYEAKPSCNVSAPFHGSFFCSSFWRRLYALPEMVSPDFYSTTIATFLTSRSLSLTVYSR